MAGVPEPGHEFDRDSVGGQRRRSFYYAEDSLRGYAQSSVVDDMYDHRYNTTAATAAATSNGAGRRWRCHRGGSRRLSGGRGDIDRRSASGWRDIGRGRSGSGSWSYGGGGRERAGGLG